MRGSVVRKGNRWYAVTEAPRDPETGKRRRKWHSGFRTRKEAETGLVDILSKLQQGIYVEPSRRTLGEFLDEWLDTIRPTVRESTWSSYRAEITKHVVPRLGSLKLQSLGPADLNSLYSELLRSGRLDGKGGLSRRTVRYIHTILRRALDAAVRWNLVPRNVAAIADPPESARRRSEVRTWSAQQVRVFLERTQGSPFHSAWTLLVTTGMRRGELLGLRWTDVDFDGRRLSINRSLVTVNYELRIEEPKTARSRRSVAIDDGTLLRLRDHRRSQIEDRLAAGVRFDESGFLFTTPDGSPIHPDHLTKSFRRLVGETGLPPIRLHDLRHTCASLALQAGIHPKVVADRLGHSSIATTLDTYSHVMPDLGGQAADLLAEIIRGQAGV